MNWILFDGAERVALFPLTFAKPIGELRVGILTIREKWSIELDAQFSYFTDGYLAKKYELNLEDDNFVINSSVLPSKGLLDRIKLLEPNQRLIHANKALAFRMSATDINNGNFKMLQDVPFPDRVDSIDRPWDIFIKNGEQIRADIKRLNLERSGSLPGLNNTLLGEDIYCEEGAKVTASIINATEGPVYIGKNAEVMEGSIIRGPFALCDSAVVKMGAKIYGECTIGPYSKVGGELNNSVIQGYSNKGHDGFLGNSVIGEWCNLGADTNNSNLKNNYGIVKAWSYKERDYVSTDRQFCGIIMGDHSKTGINTMLNTGTIVGYSANIFGGDFPPKFVNSFSWGGGIGAPTFKIDKAIEVAEHVMSRRSVELTEDDKSIMKHIFNMTEQSRTEH